MTIQIYPEFYDVFIHLIEPNTFNLIGHVKLIPNFTHICNFILILL